ncbi:MAG TPA: E2 ligase fold family C protein [Solirubrobacterales bacterium]
MAAAQVLSGFDEAAIGKRLEGITVGISYGADAAGSSEGRFSIEMAVRLLARLYPRVRISGPAAEGWRELAERINPAIEIVEDDCDFSLCVGLGGTASSGTSYYIGSNGWDALFSTQESQATGATDNPLGAGAASCLAAACLFRAVFLESVEDQRTVVLSTLDMEPRPSSSQPGFSGLKIPPATALVGVGAIGNGVLWALARSKVGGEIAVVDPERIELGNLQRYLMAAAADQGRAKVEFAREVLGEQLRISSHDVAWDEFTVANGYSWDRVLVALDSAADRRKVQASLPRWIVNGWTQPGDLGVSVHGWDEGACLACLYLAKGTALNEDELVAASLGIPHQRQEVRRLLVGGEPLGPEILNEAAAALGLDSTALLQFQGRPIRDLYVEGICGGAAIPLDRLGTPESHVHVPLAHQSALAGVLMAARFLADVIGVHSTVAEATRVDLMKPLGERLTQPVGKDPRGICICQDPIFQAAYSEKWSIS